MFGASVILLTLDDDHINITDPEAKKILKKLLDALRAEAKKRGWSYLIYVVFSRSDQLGKKVRAHYHIYLEADPRGAVTNWVMSYWKADRSKRREKIGLPKPKKTDPAKRAYYIDHYMNDQAVFKRCQEWQAGKG